MCFLRKILRFIFRKNVHADFYGLSDIDSVVTDFDPNTWIVTGDLNEIIDNSEKTGGSTRA